MESRAIGRMMSGKVLQKVGCDPGGRYARVPLMVDFLSV